MKTTLALPILVLLALATPANAEECVPTTSTTDEDTVVLELATCQPTNGVACYVAIDHPPECGVSVWLYPESNGMEGLQRNDTCHDDTCGGEVEHDAFLP